MPSPTQLARDFAADLRHTARQMLRRPAFSALVVLTLGLGIGATVALFSVVDDLLLRPLPYPGAERVHVFWNDYDWRGDEYDFVRQRPGVFESLAAFTTDGGPYHPSPNDAGSAELLHMVVGTHTLFDVLGARPMLGRAFTADDDRPGAAPVVVVSYGLWQQDLGGDRHAIGHQILLNSQTVTVVGVMPKGFFFPTPDFRAWVPLKLDPASSMYHDVGYLTLVARARAGSPPQLVQSDARRLGRALGERFTYTETFDKTKHPRAIPVREYLLGDVRDPLLLLLGAVGLLLVIACANAAALILARTSDRAGELAVRTALGAGRGRLARQLVAESLLLATCAAVVGTVLASAGFRVLVSSLPLHDGFGDTVALGGTTFVAGFALALVIACGVSLAPIRNLLRGRLDAGLMRERSDQGLRRGTRRAHAVIVGVQVCLGVLLVAGAMLLIRSVERIRSLDPGFQPHGVSTFTVVASSNMPGEPRRQFFRDLLTRVSALPGVAAAGLTNRLPVRDGGFQGPVTIEGHPELVGARRPNSLYRTATPAYFRAMGMRMAQGRGIDSTDIAASVPVTVISESFARRMWPGETAIGKHIGTGYTGTVISRTVVGVLHDPRMTSITGENPLVMFVPFEQHTSPEGAVLVVRGGGSPAALVPAVRRVAASIDPQVAIARVETMDQALASSLAEPLRLRFFLTLFAVLALALGAVGVYGVVSYAVARRRGELAIRLALGASPAHLRRAVVGQGLVPVAIGVAAGVLAAQALARVLARFLYGVPSTDPASLGAAAGALLVMGVLAALVPALRAGRTSPMEALRAE